MERLVIHGVFYVMLLPTNHQNKNKNKEKMRSQAYLMYHDKNVQLIKNLRCNYIIYAFLCECLSLSFQYVSKLYIKCGLFFFSSTWKRFQVINEMEQTMNCNTYKATITFDP